jgi:hypothetical protein
MALPPFPAGWLKLSSPARLDRLRRPRFNTLSKARYAEKVPELPSVYFETCGQLEYFVTSSFEVIGGTAAAVCELRWEDLVTGSLAKPTVASWTTG